MVLKKVCDTFRENASVLYTFCRCRTSSLSSCQNQDMGALPHYNLTGWFAQLAAVSMCWRIFGGNWQGKWSSDHFHLPLLLPLCQQEGSYFSACLFEGYGFARVDSVRESGAAAPGRYRELQRSGLACSQEKTCSHSPSKGSVWVRRQPSTRFLRSCS
jgi:hypothetical protein